MLCFIDEVSKVVIELEPTDTGLSSSLSYTVEDLNGNIIITTTTGCFTEHTGAGSGIYSLDINFSNTYFSPGDCVKLKINNSGKIVTIYVNITKRP